MAVIGEPRSRVLIAWASAHLENAATGTTVPTTIPEYRISALWTTIRKDPTVGDTLQPLYKHVAQS